MEFSFERIMDPATFCVVFATTNFVSFIIGAETIAGGTETLVPIMLPGYVYSGRVTQEFLAIYQVAESVLWVVAVIYFLVVIGALLEQSDEVVPWTADDIDE